MNQPQPPTSAMSAPDNTAPRPLPPLRDARQAALLARHIVTHRGNAVVVMLLDDSSWPIGNLIVDETTGLAALVNVIDLIATVAVDSPQLAKVVIVDIRAAGTCNPEDLDVLLEATHLLDTLGVCLLELIILTPQMYVPVGALAGLPSQW
jgi:hypothetical protein